MEFQSVEIRILASCEPAKFGKFYEDITALLKKRRRSPDDKQGFAQCRV